MSEIKVILDTSAQDIGDLPKEERDLRIEQIGVDNPELTRASLDSFIEMIDEWVNEKVRGVKPEIKELLLRKIIYLARRGNFNLHVIPIVGPFHKSALKTGRGETFVVNFDRQIFATTIDGHEYIHAAEEQLTILGVIVNPVCANPQSLDKNLSFKPISSLDLTTTPTYNLITGNYTGGAVAAACDDYFIRPSKNFNFLGEHSTASKILFEDLTEKQITAALSVIFDYFIKLDTQNHNTLSIFTQISAAVKNIAGQAKLRELFNVQPTPQISLGSSESIRTPIFDLLENIHFGRFAGVFQTSVLADMDLRGFLHIYETALLHGKDSKLVSAEINKFRVTSARKIFNANLHMKLVEEYNNLNVYRMIIERKLGVARLKEIDVKIKSESGVKLDASKILGLLTAGERKPIQMEYDKRKKYLEEVINNKCPHVALYRKFRMAYSDGQTAKLLAELKPFFKRSEGMIECNNCGFNIICPHLLEFTELTLAGKFYSDIRTKLNGYIDKTVSRGAYYCKICGETISTLDAFAESQVAELSATMDEELKMFMWSEIAILTKYLKFGNMVNVPKLITAARDACYSYIFNIEKQIIKSKTNSADEIKAKKRLYITVYAFAYFIRLAVANKDSGDISFKGLKPTSKNIVVDMIKLSIETIILSRNVIIREIHGMTPDVIKNILIEAYKSLQSTSAHIVIAAADAEEIVSTLLTDPVYKYIYEITTIDNTSHGKKVSTNKFDIVDRINEIVGHASSLEKADNIFKNVVYPKLDKWHKDKFEIFPSFSSKIQQNDYSAAYAGYLARSFELFAEKLKHQLYKEHYYVDISSGAGSKHTPDSFMNVKLRPPHEKLRDEYLKFETSEIELLKYKKLLSVQGYSFSPSGGSLLWSNPSVSIGRIFDESGFKHKWDIYVTDTGDVKLSDMLSVINSGEQFTSDIIDHKCSICGILRSATDQLSEEKIRESLRSRQIVANFFRFYENRCPKGGLHEFANSGCKKCKIISGFIVNTTLKGASEFYTNYKSIYEKDRSDLITRPDVVSSPVQVPKSAIKYDGWVFNYNVILDAAEKFKINHKLLTALGSVSGQDYAAVQNGTYIPADIDDRYNTRIFLIDSHIKNLITLYNQLKHYHKIHKPSAELVTIISASGVNKHKLSELAGKLPDIFDDYNSKLAYVNARYKPREAVNFCLQSFCEKCLVIWDDNNNETEKLRRDFVTHIVMKILRGEELLSKPGYFNWALLHGNKEEKDRASYDVNTAIDDGKGDIDDAGEEDESARPMANEFDIEKDPDADPDDEGNQWRVGENLGLD